MSPPTLWQTKISSIWRVVQSLENHPNKGLQLKVWKPPTSPVSLVEEPGFEPRACPSHPLLFVEPWGAGKSELPALCWQDHWKLWGQEAQAGRPIPLTTSVLRVRYVQEQVTWPLIDSQPFHLTCLPQELRWGQSLVYKMLIVRCVYSNRDGFDFSFEGGLGLSSGSWAGLSALAVVACRYILFCQYI